jgi:hypothetical protein
MKLSPLARALDEEFTRVAQAEVIPMHDLVEEAAALCGVSTRSLYNYRAGKWPIPASVIPILCARFKSTVLLKSLSDGVNVSPDQLPTRIEAAEMINKLISEALLHHAQLVKALAPDAEIDIAELRALEQRTERIVHHFRLLHSYAEMRYEQQAEARRRA